LRPRPLGAALAAGLPGPGRLHDGAERPRLMAARAGGLLGRLAGRDGAAAPALHHPGGGLRHLRVDGPHRADALAPGRADLPPAGRPRRRPAADPLARGAEPQGRVPPRGDAHAARHPVDHDRLDALARVTAPRGTAAAAQRDLGGGVGPDRRAADLLPRELVRGGAEPAGAPGGPGVAAAGSLTTTRLLVLSGEQFPIYGREASCVRA